MAEDQLEARQATIDNLSAFIETSQSQLDCFLGELNWNREELLVSQKSKLGGHDALSTQLVYLPLLYLSELSIALDSSSGVSNLQSVGLSSGFDTGVLKARHISYCFVNQMGCKVIGPVFYSCVYSVPAECAAAPC